MGALWSWFLHPAPNTDLPSNALIAISSVAVVIWTGGFIVRGWMKSTAAALMAGMNSLQFAFFGSILALLCNALTLRCIACGFLVYYGAFFVRHSVNLRRREPQVELFLPYLDQVRVSGTRFWVTLQMLGLVPIGLTIAWPASRVVAWNCAAMTFVGYQIILAFVYSDVFERRKTDEGGVPERSARSG